MSSTQFGWSPTEEALLPIYIPLDVKGDQDVVWWEWSCKRIRMFLLELTRLFHRHVSGARDVFAMYQQVCFLSLVIHSSTLTIAKEEIDMGLDIFEATLKDTHCKLNC
jgi:hypothetical protein